MNAIRKMTHTITAVLILLSMTVLHISAAPAYDAERNEENVRELLEEYDPEGYYIIQTTIDMGGSPISTYLGSNPSLPQTVDTVVHEMFHNYTCVKNGSSKQFRESGPFDTKDFKTLEDWDNFFNSFTVNIETIYLGKEKGDVIIEYPYADSANYKSENFAKNLPEELRTFRYDTYVCENAVASANIDGVYGLINEYGAYHWGFHNQLALYPYYKANSGYEDFFSGCMTNYQAYEEFRFWFLGLLNHERTNAPEHFEEQMKNAELMKAYYELTMQYREMIAEFEKRVREIKDLDRTGRTYLERLKYSMESYDINKLEKACSDPELKAIEDQIFAMVKGTTVPELPVDMYRLYNPNSYEHFYTGNAKEKDALVKMGWQYEGVGWTAPAKSNTPVYRLYNPNNGGDHHYTKNKKEYDALVKAGWNGEGIRWYSDDEESVPVYREYNPGTPIRNHNYTANRKEHDALVKTYGWKDEGIGWYGKK